jgi:hypothetical protein
MLINNPLAWTWQPFARFGDWIHQPMHACSAFNVDPFMEPTRYSKAIIFLHAREWKMAMEDEMKSLF